MCAGQMNAGRILSTVLLTSHFHPNPMRPDFLSQERLCSGCRVTSVACVYPHPTLGSIQRMQCAGQFGRQVGQRRGPAGEVSPCLRSDRVPFHNHWTRA